MLFVIGLGLGNEKDITVRAYEAVKTCSCVYLDAYTSILVDDCESLESFYGVPLVIADREMVEGDDNRIINGAKDSNVAFLVVGDPFCATTHHDIVLRAQNIGIEVEVFHNASIISAIAACGLDIYRFGHTVTIPFFTESWKPDSFYKRILQNSAAGLHTLCLLDIKVKEPTLASLCSGGRKKEYEPPRFMTVNQALEQLEELENIHSLEVVTPCTLFVGVARIGSRDQVIKAGSVRDLIDFDFGGPLHSLVVAAPDRHEVEEEFVSKFR
ncbi:hypothetical protein GEMRC1_008545 [Eukaryota sp. GEM-RC1]